MVAEVLQTLKQSQVVPWHAGGGGCRRAAAAAAAESLELADGLAEGFGGSGRQCGGGGWESRVALSWGGEG